MDSVEILNSAQNYLFYLFFVFFFCGFSQQVLAEVPSAILAIEEVHEWAAENTV